MSAKPQQQHIFQAVGRSFGLESHETQVFENKSVYVDGSAVVDRQIDISAALRELFKSKPPPVNVTVFLPPTLSFAVERQLIRKIADAGGSVALLKTNESFSQVSDQRRKLVYTPDPSYLAEEFAALTPQFKEPNLKRLAPYFYNRAERRALRKDYKSDSDSSSIVS
jgi:hypothetical protein